MFRVYCKDIECYPKRAHATDAGLDLKAAETIALIPGEITKVPCGIHIELMQGFAAFLFPRSGLASKFGINLANGVGVVDSEYRGEIMCAMQTQEYYTINKYDRIAQMVIMPYWTGILENVDELYKLSTTDRGEGGFGHTGK